MQQASSRLRIAMLRIQFPGLQIDPGTFIGPGCDIACADDARMEIHGTHIGRACTLRADHGATLAISAASLGAHCVVVARDRVIIGADCSIAEMVVIRDQDHVLTTEISVAQARFSSAPVTVGRGVWVGSKATILRGTNVGAGAVIAAHSVVRTDVEPGALYAGVPARRVR